jgi:fumarate hydratase class I
MPQFRDAIAELYKKAATSLPEDVEAALRRALRKESKGSQACIALSAILDNIEIARESKRPVCQDTGVPVFFVNVPAGMSHLKIRDDIVRATRMATKQIPLRPNAVDVLTDTNSGDNTGIGFPVMYFGETKTGELVIDIMLKGSGSENIGRLYKLPATALRAERDLEGVRRCVLDAVYRAQGRGCPPYIVGVGIGATRDQVTRVSKAQLIRNLLDTNENKVLSQFEKRLLHDINCLGIGPLGFGGRTTALGVKIGVTHRHPASYFVDISLSCWADRRARLKWKSVKG